MVLARPAAAGLLAWPAKHEQGVLLLGSLLALAGLAAAGLARCAGLPRARAKLPAPTSNEKYSLKIQRFETKLEPWMQPLKG